MNYSKIYYSLIQKASSEKRTCYTERHHILPKSLGGSDSTQNLVELTAREHYIAHLLLYKMYQGDALARSKMIFAVICMRCGNETGKRSYKFNSRLYEKMRLKYINVLKGTIWIYSLDRLETKRWPKTAPVPDGWEIGRHYVRTMEKMVRIKEKLQKIKDFDNGQFFNPSICQSEKQIDKKIELERNRSKRDELLCQMYHDYLEIGFDRVRTKYNYTKSRENLIMAFKRHVPEYDKTTLLKVSTAIKRELKGYDQSKKNRNMPKEEKIRYFTEMYFFFKEFGFQKTVEKYEWQSSRNAMVQNFKNYVKEYVPTKTRRWG